MQLSVARRDVFRVAVQGFAVSHIPPPIAVVAAPVIRDESTDRHVRVRHDAVVTIAGQARARTAHCWQRVCALRELEPGASLQLALVVALPNANRRPSSHARSMRHRIGPHAPHRIRVRPRVGVKSAVHYVAGALEVLQVYRELDAGCL